MHWKPLPTAAVTAVIGAQWGDEGKGKLIDLLSTDADIVARACGGANAGHTIVVNGVKHVFRLLPSGCLHQHVRIVLGSGMVIHLPTLLEEIRVLRDVGVDILPRLHLSSAAHILFDFHKEMDGLWEERRAKTAGGSIGTTRRGIGPAYVDKAARRGIRLEHLGSDLRGMLVARAQELAPMGVTVNVDRELAHLADAAQLLAARVTDTVALLHEALEKGQSVLLEGAQATLLDIDHGTYPYVTSSSTTVAGALQGLGIPPHAVRQVIGVAKAYCTRVGGGPFPTEAEPSAAQRLRDRGGEYGSVTGRPRRCGWIHVDDLRRSAAINGFHVWNITKLDVLDTEEVIPVGIGTHNGVPVYEYLSGWKTSTAGITDFAKLPVNAQQFLRFLEDQTGIPVAYVGTGQGRGEMIVRKEISP